MTDRMSFTPGGVNEQLRCGCICAFQRRREHDFFDLDLFDLDLDFT